MNLFLFFFTDLCSLGVLWVVVVILASKILLQTLKPSEELVSFGLAVVSLGFILFKSRSDWQ